MFFTYGLFFQTRFINKTVMGQFEFLTPGEVQILFFTAEKGGAGDSQRSAALFLFALWPDSAQSLRAPFSAVKKKCST
jgi:hypothetical protein